MTTTYTTPAKVRDDAGFTGNTFISDPSIDSQRLRAFGVINTYVGMRFALPILSLSVYADSPASEFLDGLEMSLAAGYLLINEFGNEARGTDKDWYRRVSDAMKILDDVRDGKISLFGSDGNVLPPVLSQNKPNWKIRGLPNNSNSDDYPRRFSVNDKF